MKRKKFISNKAVIRLLFVMWTISVLIYSERSSTVIYSDLLSIILMAFIGMGILGKKRLIFPFPIILLFIFTFICFCSIIWAKFPLVALQRSITVAILTIFTFLLYQYFYYNNDELFILKAIPISGIIVSLYTINYYGVSGFIDKIQNGVRIGTEFVNANNLGLFCGITVVLLTFHAQRYKLLYLTTLLPLTIVFASGSRKALVFTIMGVTAIYFFKVLKTKKLNNFIKNVFIIIIVLIIGYYLINLPIFSLAKERMLSLLGMFSISDTKVDESTKIRMEMIRIGTIQFQQSPILGIGIGCSNYLTLKYLGTSTYLHNNYIELLATVGLVGTISYYSIYFNIFKNLYFKKEKKNLTQIVAVIILLSQLIMDYGQVSYFSKITYIYLLLGVLISSRKNVIQKIH